MQLARRRCLAHPHRLGAVRQPAKQVGILRDDERPRLFEHRRRRLHGCVEQRADRRRFDPL
jgi:hypothetical protein